MSYVVFFRFVVYFHHPLPRLHTCCCSPQSGAASHSRRKARRSQVVTLGWRQLLDPLDENGWMNWDDHEVGKEWAVGPGDAIDCSVVETVGTGVLSRLGVGECSC